METSNLNSYGDFLPAITVVLSDQLNAYATAMKQGKPTSAIEDRLQQLDLVRRASAYWPPESIQKASIYLKIFANV